ncbi:MAG: hypothetical protein EAZ89_15205, partial [Bacteroidetes bacterium]
SDCQVNQRGFRIAYRAISRNPECPNPENLIAGDIFPMGATLSWNKVADAGSYKVTLRRKIENASEIFFTSGNSLTVTGLSSNALYQWQVQCICGGDSSAVIGNSFLTPNIMNTSGQAQVYSARLNTGKLHDSGGVLGAYTNNENYLYRIIPPDGGKVELRFSRFETQQDKDILTVYDGLNTSGKVLGSYSGKVTIPTLTSSGNGLTVQFVSDGRDMAPGWVASWKSIGGTGQGTGGQGAGNSGQGTGGSGTAGNGGQGTGNNGQGTGNNGNSGNAGNTGGTKPEVPATPGSFDPGLVYSAAHPETAPELKDAYPGTFTLSFADRDRSGRGLNYRFYNIAGKSAQGWKCNPQAGFFYEDFSRLGSEWKSVTGTWAVSGGRLTQSDPAPDNTNLYTDLRQSNQDIFLYHWRAAMTGSGTNRRHGLHFFASTPETEDRGTSYFVLVRDTDTEDYVEVYKTVNDQFDRKIRQVVKLEKGKVYDYKVVANMKTGRIEVFVNDAFV